MIYSEFISDMTSATRMMGMEASILRIVEKTREAWEEALRLMTLGTSSNQYMAISNKKH
jgi:hypothetical protein